MSVNTDRHENAIARYLEAWNAREPQALTKAVAAAWTADGSYTDPLADVRGHDQIAAVIAAAHTQFPGFTFRLLGTVDGHHDTARFSWELVNEADTTAPVAGFDVVTLDDEGRIRQVLGFLDRVPAGA
ncbi:nuclear transport factor 2 family protein [Streptomyces sp. NPDC002520]